MSVIKNKVFFISALLLSLLLLRCDSIYYVVLKRESIKKDDCSSNKREYFLEYALLGNPSKERKARGTISINKKLRDVNNSDERILLKAGWQKIEAFSSILVWGHLRLKCPATGATSFDSGRMEYHEFMCFFDSPRRGLILFSGDCKEHGGYLPEPLEK